MRGNMYGSSHKQETAFEKISDEFVEQLEEELVAFSSEDSFVEDAMPPRSADEDDEDEEDEDER